MGAGGGTIVAMPSPGQAISSLFRGVQWGLDRMLSVGYGVVYDYIVASFRPYQELHGEVLRRVETAVAPGANRREVRVLDVACGPGNFTLALATAGFETVGVDAYAGLVDLAREKRKAHRLANLAFRHADLERGGMFPESTFDQVVNIHSLYIQPDPQRLLREVHRVLKPGGRAVFVNYTRRVWLRSAVREVKRREGTRAALRCLLWVLPNSIFEAMRKRAGPHYWAEEEFTARLRQAGFTVLDVRPTFFNGVSLLAWVQKDGPGAVAQLSLPQISGEGSAGASVAPPSLSPARERSRIRHSVERLIAVAYGFTYDVIVEAFEPYQTLLREVRGFVERAYAGKEPAAVKILDVACGTGTVALELARHGYSVMGVDIVAPLVRIARERQTPVPARFEHLDVAADPVPGAGTYDVVVSMHTLYWHPNPQAFLEGCRRALKPAGHALFLTYSRPARVVRTFGEVRARQGTVSAIRALRWLVPTALFEWFRDYEPHYMGEEEFHGVLAGAGFQVLEARRTFLADISLLAWVCSKAEPGGTTKDGRQP